MIFWNKHPILLWVICCVLLPLVSSLAGFVALKDIELKHIVISLYCIDYWFRAYKDIKLTTTKDTDNIN